MSVDSDPFSDEHRVDVNGSQRDPKLGPKPRAAGLDPRSPADKLGFKVRSGYRNSGESQRPLLDPESESDDESNEDGGLDYEDDQTIYPHDSISLAPSRPAHSSSRPTIPVSPMPTHFGPHADVPQPLQPQARVGGASSSHRPSHQATVQSEASGSQQGENEDLNGSVSATASEEAW